MGLDKMADFPRRGELYWADLSPVIGSEAANLRPVLIVSNDANNKVMKTITVVPLTSSVHRIYPFEVYLEQGEANLTQASKAQAQQVRTISRERLSGVIGKISETSMLLVNSALKAHLDLD